MKIALGTIEVDDFYRRAIWWHYNRSNWPDSKNPAKCPMETRDECRQFIFDHGWGFVEMDVAYQYQDALDCYNNPL